jgi:hypothetical protein
LRVLLVASEIVCVVTAGVRAAGGGAVEDCAWDAVRVEVLAAAAPWRGVRLELAVLLSADVDASASARWLRRTARLQGVDSAYCIDVPPGFDDSDDDSQVHPMARRMFTGHTAAEVFAKAQDWVSQHSVFLVDVSWNWAQDEPQPFILSVYFTFELDPDAEE